jgi:hypothetical protein
LVGRGLVLLSLFLVVVLRLSGFVSRVPVVCSLGFLRFFRWVSCFGCFFLRFCVVFLVVSLCGLCPRFGCGVLSCPSYQYNFLSKKKKILFINFYFVEIVSCHINPKSMLDNVKPINKLMKLVK